MRSRLEAMPSIIYIKFQKHFPCRKQLGARQFEECLSSSLLTREKFKNLSNFDVCH
jgi:hypothetical protein